MTSALEQKENSMNLVTLVGNLGHDVQIETSNDGNTTYARLSLATNYRDQATWHDVVVFGTAAQHLNKLGKGSSVAIRGHLKTQTYQVGDKTIRYSQVVGDYVEFVHVKPPSAGSEPAGEVPASAPVQPQRNSAVAAAVA